MKKCRKCGYEGPLTDFHPHKRCKDGYETLCHKCQAIQVRYSEKKNYPNYLERNKRYSKAHPESVKRWNAKRSTENRLVDGAKRRAKKRKVPFTITVKDIYIPEFCPVLGIILQRGNGKCSANSPSLDARIPELGYVLGNIQVISFKANTMKSNATLEELKKLVAWLESKET